MHSAKLGAGISAVMLVNRTFKNIVFFSWLGWLGETLFLYVYLVGAL
jgi:hypothetical protein